jgi:hypothetical protein
MKETNPTPKIRLTPERRLELMVKIAAGHLASGQIDLHQLVTHAEAKLDMLVQLVEDPIELARFGEILEAYVEENPERFTPPIPPSTPLGDPVERKYRIQLAPDKRLEFLVELAAGVSATGTQALSVFELGELLDKLLCSVEEHVTMQPDQFDLPPATST